MDLVFVQNLVVLFLNLLLEVQSVLTIFFVVNFLLFSIRFHSLVLTLFRGSFKAKCCDKGSQRIAS